MSNSKKSIIWVALGVVVVAGLILFGGPLLAPADPDDAAMKVRRPTPAARRAPGQIGVDHATDPNATAPNAPAGGGTDADTGDDEP